jgi:hypothetical protein
MVRREVLSEDRVHFIIESPLSTCSGGKGVLGRVSSATHEEGPSIKYLWTDRDRDRIVDMEAGADLLLEMPEDGQDTGGSNTLSFG